MALPYQGEQTNVASALQGLALGPLAQVPSIGVGVGAPALQGAIPGQQNLANLAQGVGIAGTGAGIPGAADIQAFLSQTGQTGVNAATQLFNQGVQAEQTGALPPGGAQFFQTQLNDEIQAIRGKFAGLGMSGSTAEQTAITDATNRNALSQFQAALQLGGAETGQATSFLGQVLGGLSTSGNLATTLGQLGIQGFQLSANDIANIAREGLSSLGLAGEATGQQANIFDGEANIFGNLAQTQLNQDNQLTNTLGAFFKAAAGNQGLYGSQGLIPGLQGTGSSVAGLFGGGGASAAGDVGPYLAPLALA